MHEQSWLKSCGPRSSGAASRRKRSPPPTWRKKNSATMPEPFASDTQRSWRPEPRLALDGRLTKIALGGGIHHRRYWSRRIKIAIRPLGDAEQHQAADESAKYQIIERCQEGGRYP